MPETAEHLRVITQHEIRRQAAIRAFWSDHPLNIAFRKTGKTSFSLREFIAFVSAMPADQFTACMIGARP